MRFIGDVHGKYKQYKKIIKETDRSIQVGDMGVGFYRLDKSPMANPPFDTMSKGDHRFIRGNHDNPNVCKQLQFWISDGHYEDDTFFVGGALSIDRQYRTPNHDWWEDEELSYGEFLELQTKYLDLKPKIMVTHDCPEIIANDMVSQYNWTKFNDPSITRQAFNNFWELHKPELWIYGHWHHSHDEVLLGTRFVCLAELEYIDL